MRRIQSQEKKKAPVMTEAFPTAVDFDGFTQNPQAPPVGLEPTTMRLTAARSTN